MGKAANNSHDVHFTRVEFDVVILGVSIHGAAELIVLAVELTVCFFRFNSSI